MPRAKQADPVFLTPEEIERLARATRTPCDVLVRLATATGIRPSELCGLQVGRLDLLPGTIDVVDALAVVRGHAGARVDEKRRAPHGKPHALVVRRPRQAPRRGAHELDRALEPDGFVFVAPRGGPLRRDLLCKRIFVPAVKEAGPRPGLRLHDLRHTCASLLIQLGAHPKVIQEWLGHRSITVTMDVYGHLYPSLAEARTERLDEVFAKARSVAPVSVSAVPSRTR